MRILVIGWPLLALVFAAAGCESTNGPEFGPLINREFEQIFTAESPSDSLLIAIGTSWRGRSSPAEVHFEVEPAATDSVRFTFRVVGKTPDTKEPAVIESKLSGDTLYVWCANFASEFRTDFDAFAKTSPIPPWLVPEHVAIAVPEGVWPVFIGHWYE